MIIEANKAGTRCTTECITNEVSSHSYENANNDSISNITPQCPTQWEYYNIRTHSRQVHNNETMTEQAGSLNRIKF